MKIRPRLNAELYLGFFLLCIVLLLLVFAPGFFSLNNIMSTLNRFSYLLIPAIGMTIIIITANIDVSAGPLISVICLFIAAVGKTGVNIAVIFLAAIAMGIFLSMMNVLFITVFKIPAIVVTLATAQLFTGAMPIFVEGSIYDLPPSFTWLAFSAKLFGIIPASIVIMLIVAAFFLLFMKYTRFSKKIYAIGNNVESARLSGIDVTKTTVLAFLTAGILYGISAAIIATASQRVTMTMGMGLEMQFIAAALLGGTSVSGGRGTILGTVFGTLILSIIAPASNYLGINPDYSDLVTGIIIVVSVVINLLNSNTKTGEAK
ncbi:MAG: ABC transporter permease [Treponema sp.]|jgi:ribose/xylose/arabinose/galactoside ABC-type transport system permease subunit|nr:ABC transporter permease [Treponema sp.]